MTVPAYLLATASISALCVDALPPLWPLWHAERAWGVCRRCGRGDHIAALYGRLRGPGFICFVCAHLPAPLLRRH